MLLRESQQLFEFDEVGCCARPEFVSLRPEQSPLDPAADLAEPHSQMHRELAEGHRVPAHLGVLLPVQEVVEALRLVAELLRGGVDAMVGDVLDQFVTRLTIKRAPGCRAWPLDAVPGHECPTCALAFARQGRKLFANRNRVLVLPQDLKRLRRPSQP